MIVPVKYVENSQNIWDTYNLKNKKKMFLINFNFKKKNLQYV